MKLSIRAVLLLGMLLSQAAGIGAGVFSPVNTTNIHSVSAQTSTHLRFTRSDYQLGNFPVVGVADFDNDGQADILTQVATNRLRFLKGNGDGTFAPPTEVGTTCSSAPLSGRFAAIADFNNDGLLDLASPMFFERLICVLTNAGNGVFVETEGVEMSERPRHITTGDVDRDGRIDIITANAEDNTVSVIYNTTEGFYPEDPILLEGQNPFDVALIDVNGDPYLDIVTANIAGMHGNSTRGISVLLGNGEGFDDPMHFGTPVDECYLTTGDFNEDSRIDVVVTGVGSITTYLNMGQGAFNSGTQRISRHDYPMIVSGDITGDGNLDAVTAHFDGDSLLVLEGMGNGLFSTEFVLPVGSRPTTMALADFNGDGKLDIAAGNFQDDTISVLLATTAPIVVPPPPPPATGIPAILWARDTGNMAVWTMNGLDLVDAFQVNTGKVFLRNRPPMAFADFSGDLQPDILFKDAYVGATAGFLSGQTLINARNLSGFQPGEIIGLADMNHDGQKDLLLLRGNILSIALMRGTRSIDERVIHLTPWFSANLHWRRFVGSGDFNGDGRNDLLWETPDRALRVDFLNGTTFLKSTTLKIEPSAWRAVGVKDFNGDNSADILVQHTDRRVAVWLMQGINRTSTTLLRDGKPVARGWKVVGTN